MALVTSVHLVFFVIDIFALVYDFSYIKAGHEGFGGKYKYLTIWNITLQTLYYGVNVLKDITEGEADAKNPSRRSSLQKLRDAFHSCIAFPTGMFVVTTFWILYFIDRELVYPEKLDKIVPPWLNHALHTLVFPFLMVDKLIVHHHYPKKHIGISVSCGLALVYLMWILFIAYYDNFWVYPILEVLDTTQRIIFISMCLSLFASLYILGEALTTFLWRSKGRSTQTTRSRKQQ